MSVSSRLLAAVIATASVAALTVPTAHAAPARKAAPASGTVVHACNLQPFDSDFDYSSKTTLAGTKPSPKSKLTARLSPMPGLAPVAISGKLAAKLKAVVGGKAVTLTGSRDVDVAANKPVPMPVLHGTVKLTKKTRSATVVVKSLTFTMPSYGISGSCGPTRGAKLSTLRFS